MSFGIELLRISEFQRPSFSKQAFQKRRQVLTQTGRKRVDSIIPSRKRTIRYFSAYLVLVSN